MMPVHAFGDWLRLIAILAIGWLVSGCASSGSISAFTPDALLIVPTPIQPRELEVTVLLDQGAVVPILGLVNFFGRENTTEEIERAFSSSGFSFAEMLQSEVVNELNSKGIKAQGVAFDRGKKYDIATFGKPSDLPSVAGAAGIIDISVDLFGFIANTADADYKPVVSIQWRVIDPDNRDVMWKRTLSYNWPSPSKNNPAIIPGVPEDKWEDRQALAKDIPGLMAGLTRAATELARSISGQLVAR